MVYVISQFIIGVHIYGVSMLYYCCPLLFYVWYAVLVILRLLRVCHFILCRFKFIRLFMLCDARYQFIVGLYIWFLCYILIRSHDMFYLLLCRFSSILFIMRMPFYLSVGLLLCIVFYWWYVISVF